MARFLGILEVHEKTVRYWIRKSVLAAFRISESFVKKQIKIFNIMWLALIDRNTATIRINPSLSIEIHTLICHKDIMLYILSIKSFLRFYNNISVVAHEDGSINNSDIKLLNRHLPGIRIIEKKYADKITMEALETYPHIKKFRKDHLIAVQAVDYFLFAESDRIISLDSDTLFLQRPDRVIEWISNQKKDEILCLYEMNPNMQNEIFHKTQYAYQPNICAGFICCYKELLDMELTDSFLSKLESLNEINWWTSQNIYSLLIKNSDRYNVTFLNKEDYQDPNTFHLNNTPSFRHYWRSYMDLYVLYKKDIRRFIKELKQIQREEKR